MKPPPRKRTRPSRELPECPPRGRALCKWPLKDLRKLLAVLTKLNTEEPLDPERVREQLPTRTAAEINLFLEALKEKIVVFAKRKEYAERRQERRPRKPLEIWIQEASAVSVGAEETLSAAFTQMLTVTSIEPCAPPQPQTPAQPPSTTASSVSSPLLCPTPSIAQTPLTQTPAVTEDLTKTPQPHPTPGTSPSVRRTPLPSKMTEVSFEKIYHYLSSLHKPSEQRKLTPMESAIVLDLLMSLPEELQLLDCDPLREHLSQVYLNLPPHEDSRRTKGSKGVKRRNTSAVSDPAPDDNSSTQRTSQPPLNPFRIPVSLLSRNTPTNPT